MLVTGTVTSVCVESTARDGTLRTVYRSFGDVRATDEVLDLLVG